MTKNDLFERQVLPALQNAIEGKVILFFTGATIETFSSLGFIKEREPLDCETDSFVECGDYLVKFHTQLGRVTKISKGNSILYEYHDATAFLQKATPLWLEID